VEDYASTFQMPLLADIGKKITLVDPDNQYFGKHPYNNDQDLLGLTLSYYFGSGATIGGRTYDDIFDYIQYNVMRPLHIPREAWYFPGQSADSIVDNADAISLTVSYLVVEKG
jgi:hypothetical protein